jgi:hypothetical protein
MSFGFSIGDFVTIIELVTKIQKDFAAAPVQFKDISDEYLGCFCASLVLADSSNRAQSLSTILRDIDAVLSDRELDDEHWREISERCRSLLGEIQRTLHKYGELKSCNRQLSTKVKRAWKSLTWEPKHISELRDRLTSNVALLNACLGRISMLVPALKLASWSLIRVVKQRWQLNIAWTASINYKMTNSIKPF